MRLMNWLAAFGVAALASSPALAYRGGPIAGVTGSPASLGNTCRLCHGNAAGGGSVQILNAPAQYQANQVYELTIRVSDPAQRGGGFEISVETPAGVHVGQLLIVEPLYTLYADSFPPEQWVSHSFEGVERAVANWAAMGNAAEYRVGWRAPATDMGTIRFYVAGNAINDNFDHTGDRIYTTNAVSTFRAPCPADLDGNGQVGASDLAALLGAWGASGPADLDGDGQVGSSDLAALLGAWGPCG